MDDLKRTKTISVRVSEALLSDINKVVHGLKIAYGKVSRITISSFAESVLEDAVLNQDLHCKRGLRMSALPDLDLASAVLV